MAGAQDQVKIDEFVNLVLKNLEKNGYPQQIVTFSLEKMYESASQRGFSFNKVRDILLEKGIQTQLTEERVIFSPVSHDTAPELDLQTMMQKIMQQLSPEQQAQIDQMLKHLPAEELDKMKAQWEAMSPEDKSKQLQAMKNMSR